MAKSFLFRVADNELAPIEALTVQPLQVGFAWDHEAKSRDVALDLIYQRLSKRCLRSEYAVHLWSSDGDVLGSYTVANHADRSVVSPRPEDSVEPLLLHDLEHLLTPSLEIEMMVDARIQASTMKSQIAELRDSLRCMRDMNRELLKAKRSEDNQETIDSMMESNVTPLRRQFG